MGDIRRGPAVVLRHQDRPGLGEIVARVVLHDARDRDRRRRLGLRELHPGTKPRHHEEARVSPLQHPMFAAGQQAREHRDGHEALQRRAPRCAKESLGRHPHDGERHAIEPDGFSDDPRVGAEARAPGLEGEHQQRIGPRRLAFGRQEKAAEVRLHSEHGEIVVRHRVHPATRARLAGRVQVDRLLSIGHRPGEHALQVRKGGRLRLDEAAEVFDVGEGESDLETDRRGLLREDGEPLGLVRRQRAKKEIVGDRVEHGVDRQAEHEGRHGHEGERGSARDLAQCQAQIRAGKEHGESGGRIAQPSFGTQRLDRIDVGGAARGAPCGGHRDEH